MCGLSVLLGLGASSVFYPVT